MSILDSTPRISASNLIFVTPTITAGAYTSGFQLGGIMTLPNAVRYNSSSGVGTSYLMSATILDKSGTSPAIDVWFFKSSPTLTSVNGQAFDLTDANLVASTIGVVSIGSIYSTSTSNGVSTDGGGIVKLMATSSASSSLFAVAVIRSGVTFGSTSDITFLFGFSQD